MNDLGEYPEKYGMQWKYTFWTNHPASIEIDEEACNGHCNIRNINELKHLVLGEVSIDFLSPDLNISKYLSITNVDCMF